MSDFMNSNILIILGLSVPLTLWGLTKNRELTERIVGILLLLSGFYLTIGIPVLHFIKWLKTGHYTPYTLYDLLNGGRNFFPDTGWVKVDDFLYWISFKINLHWTSVILGGIFLVPALFALADDLGKPDKSPDE